MSSAIMRSATCFTLAMILGATFTAVASADIPKGKVAVVMVRAIDGLGGSDDRRDVTGSAAYHIDTRSRSLALSRAGIGSIDGVKTIVLVERRSDSNSGGELVQKYAQSILTSDGSSFEVEGLDGSSLAYHVGVHGGRLVVTGPGDHISVQGGKSADTYQIWKVSPIGLFDRDKVEIY